MSAYFLSGSRFKLKSLKKIWGITLFYSISIYMLLVVFHVIPINPKDALKSFLPVLTGNYWYVSAYIGMYILVPYMNLVIEYLNKKDFQKLLITLFVMFSLLPYMKNITVITNNNSVINLVYIYFIGGYLRKYNDDFSKDKMKYYILSFIGSLVLMLASIIVIDFIKPNHWFAFLTTSSPLEAIAGISLFLIAKNITISYNEIINKIAASTFAVYLIHCQAIFFPILWNKIVRADQWQSVPYTVGYELLVACVIYCGATLIDFIRIYILKTYLKFKVRFVG
ncbi:acyltransferase family protein [Lactobacillus gasseri]|uniref:acyltransferase family protein n=1 Tax=Lactobacillus gasseri TaxID=1596 RepID=UPI003BA06CEB